MIRRDSPFVTSRLAPRKADRCTTWRAVAPRKSAWCTTRRGSMPRNVCPCTTPKGNLPRKSAWRTATPWAPPRKAAPCTVCSQRRGTPGGLSRRRLGQSGTVAGFSRRVHTIGDALSSFCWWSAQPRGTGGSFSRHHSGRHGTLGHIPRHGGTAGGTPAGISRHQTPHRTSAPWHGYKKSPADPLGERRQSARPRRSTGPMTVRSGDRHA